VLADCLEERAPGQFSVVDRTTVPASRRLDGVRELAPAAIVVAFGARDTGLRRLLREVRETSAHVIVVGVGAPTKAWSDELAALARAEPGIEPVDLLVEWPTDDAGQAALATGGALSDQGHARVAAALCDAVLRPPK
jgi:hypothetical protein